MNTTDVKKTDNIITLEHVTFQYNKEEGTPVQVLKDISLDIQAGSFVAVLGHNGCGKSTLAKHMNAILLPSGGTVYVNGMDTRSDEECAGQCGARWAWCSRTRTTRSSSNVVEEDVAFAPENLGVPAGGDPPPGGQGSGDRGHERLQHPRTPPALRRAEAAGGHCGHHRHGTQVHCPGRAYRHAGPHRPAGGAGDHPSS